MQSVTEIQLNKLRAHFRARFAPMIWANCAPLNVWGGGYYYIGANQAGKRAHSLFTIIIVTVYSLKISSLTVVITIKTCPVHFWTPCMLLQYIET